MADMPTIIETGKNNDNGWGNGPWGAGVGAFIGSMFGNGGFGGWGWGNGGRAMQAGADVALANQIEHLGDQIQQVGVAQLQGQNQLGLQGCNNTGAVKDSITQGTIANMQGFGGVQTSLCQLGRSLSSDIDANGDQVTGAITDMNLRMGDRLCAINGNITQQGYEERLQNQQLAAQGQLQFSQLQAQTASEACATRELIRETAAQAVRDKLTECQNELAAQKAQNNLMVALGAVQTNIINALKPATTTAAGA